MPAHDTQSQAPASAADYVGFRSRVPANWTVDPEKVSDALNMLAAPGGTTIVTSAAVIPDKALALGTGGARGVEGSASLSADGNSLIGLGFTKSGSEKNTLEFISAGASAVNWLGISNHLTGNAPILAARSDTDANVGIAVTPKGTGEITLNAITHIETKVVVDGVEGTSGNDLVIDSGGAADELHFHTGGTERARIDVYSRLLLNDIPNPAAGQGWKFQAYEPDLSCQGRYECVSNTASHKASWFLLRTRHTGAPANRAQCNAGDDIGLFGYKLWTSGASTPTRGGLAGFAATATTTELYLRAGSNADYIHIKDGGDADFLTSGVRVGFNDSTTHYLEHSAGALTIRGPATVIHAGADERIAVNSTGIGFNAATPIARPDYTITNPAVRRTIDVAAITHAQLAEVVGTMIQDKIDYGLFQ